MFIGIDVSDNNGVLDWDAIKESGKCNFTMIRQGYGSNYASQDDKQAIRNMQECERLNIPYGGYIYGYALNEDEAKSEAEHAIRMSQGFNPVIGLYMDMEDADNYKVRNGLVPEENGQRLTDFCTIFKNRIKEAGYGTGTYANKNYLDNVLVYDQLKNDPIWGAIWGPTKCPSEEWTMWQYSSDGEVPGSSSRTDMNYYLLPELPMLNVPENVQIEEPIPEKPIESPSTTYKVGDNVDYDKIYYESGAWQPMDPTYHSGVIIQIFEGSRNPYLLEGAIGFLNDDCITGIHSEKSEPESTTIVQSEESYTIKSGDTLGQIAQRFGIDSATLAQYNNIADANMIYAGDTIQIPTYGSAEEQEVEPTETEPQNDATATVLPGEGFWQVAARTLGDGNRYIELAQYNGLDLNTTLYEGMTLRLPQ